MLTIPFLTLLAETVKPKSFTESNGAKVLAIVIVAIIIYTSLRIVKRVSDVVAKRKTDAMIRMAGEVDDSSDSSD